ncbi:MAG: class I SAM-dependent methyltransferase [Nitrospirae bacterium]|nr:MAG: class I SAM-dependent methyltransferase [Nitrospirota bacterium]
MMPHAEHDSLVSDLEALAGLENYHGWILDEIRPYLKPRLVEIGGGIGTFTKLLVQAHLLPRPATRLEVFEPASAFCLRLRDALQQAYPDLLRTGRLVVTGTFFQPAPDQCDTVIMVNVLEHIQDDQESIRAAYQSLSPGGTFIVYSPALPWLYSPHDKAVGHYRRYKMNGLEQLMRKEGFVVVAAKYMDCMGVIPWYLLNVIGGSTSINPHLARLYDQWFVPVTRLVERLWHPRIGKNVLVVARKDDSPSAEMR